MDKISQDLERAAAAAVPGRAGFDYLIVGAGFAGSVLAERLANVLGKRVLIVDKRPHIGGNAYDRYDDAGVLVHPYGPHIFHTNSEDIFDYLSQFTQWRQYQHRVLASVDGQLVPMPINLDTINKLYGLNLTSFEVEKFFESVAEKKEEIKTSEDVVVSKVGRELYNKFFRGYTRKQWGLDPSELDASVTARVPTRTNRDDRYFADKFQAMPLQGYTRMFERMLAHPNIKVLLNCDYRDIVDVVPWKHMVYSGPVDAFFDYKYGKLPYRSLRFEHVNVPKEQFQQVGTVNYPNDYGYTRISEFKHITGQEHPTTSVVYEYPCAEGDPYYPVPRPENAELYRRYEAEADATPNVTFVGRLATYRYYNMDQVVGQALAAFKRLQAAHAAAERTIDDATALAASVAA
ncbi:UDP-galactopyranose mutase [Ramlibacter ginsenosidimutans]|uniref:UDP-galactopyranose mutase n=1 Tax=Ramlibacter ginsenosidimutans TaxID=502333 RepID=A0A934WKX0_9BURK|nr:UDP-galactopyranose mutase [Ramlibacter ginsenosidimutans]MBK6004956.1 UDP-galactopyranose mutase [Ramlibacter ginsenosidimutans]